MWFETRPEPNILATHFLQQYAQWQTGQAITVFLAPQQQQKKRLDIADNVLIDESVRVHWRKKVHQMLRARAILTDFLCLLFTRVRVPDKNCRRRRRRLTSSTKQSSKCLVCVNQIKMSIKYILVNLYVCIPSVDSSP